MFELIEKIMFISGTITVVLMLIVFFCRPSATDQRNNVELNSVNGIGIVVRDDLSGVNFKGKADVTEWETYNEDGSVKDRGATVLIR